MIDALLASLEHEADAEIARVREGAQAQVAELTRAAQQHMAERREQTLGRRETELRAELERALATARASARAQVLKTRAALLDRLFARLRAELSNVAASAPYRAQLPAQLKTSLGFAGDQPVTVRCNPALADTLRSVLRSSGNGNGRLHLEPDRDIAAGFLLTTTALEIDATLENELERLRPRLALLALRMLSA